MDRDGIRSRYGYSGAEFDYRAAKDRQYKSWIWAVAEIDPALLSNEIERVNITLPKRVLTRLDNKAKAAGETRSGFIAHLALTA